MELQPVNNQQEMAQKDFTVKFVHDITDMAVRAYTLKNAADKLREELAAEEKKLDPEIQKAKWGLEKENGNLQKSEREYKRNYRTYLSFFFHDPFHDGWAKIPILPTLIFAFGFSISMGLFVSNGDLPARIVADSFLAVYALFSFILHTVCIVNYKRRKKWKLSSIQLCKNRVNEAIENLKQMEDEYNHFIDVTFVNGLKRSEEMNEAANEIDEMLLKCYALNIVKPDYQNLVCLLILDNIFMNDKADTMREAMLLCDTELRHNELVGKLNEVVHALHTLSKRLQGLDRVMNSIDANISRVSQEASRMADMQEQISYATESIQKSAENTDFFIAQHRAGAL